MVDNFGQELQVERIGAVGLRPGRDCHGLRRKCRLRRQPPPRAPAAGMNSGWPPLCTAASPLPDPQMEAALNACLENHGRELAHDGQRTHVDHQIVVAEAAPRSVRKTRSPPASRTFSTAWRMSHGETNCPFLMFTAQPLFPAAIQQSVWRQRNAGICTHRRPRLQPARQRLRVRQSARGLSPSPDPAENAQTFVQPRPAKAANRSAIGLVVRSFEDVRQFFVASDGSNGVSHLERVSFALDDAGPGDEEELASADGNVADLERLDHTVAL